MTLLVVSKDGIHVDSFRSCGDLKFNIGARKIATHYFDDQTYVKYALAGSCDDADRFFQGVRTFEQFLSKQVTWKSQDNTVCIARFNERPEVYLLEFEEGHAFRVLTTDSEVNYMAGAGWHWFEAYYAQTRDVELSFKMVCDNHHLVEWPMNTF